MLIFTLIASIITIGAVSAGDNTSLINDTLNTTDLNNLNYTNTNTNNTNSNTNSNTQNTNNTITNTNNSSAVNSNVNTGKAAGGDSLNAAGGKPTTLTHTSILSAASSIASYVKKYGKLPNYVTISGYNFSMPEFLYLLTKATENTYKNNKASITIRYDVKNPPKASGANILKKYFTKAGYYDAAKKISAYIIKYKVAPNFATTKVGKAQYQTLVYTYAQILDYYKKYKKLPTKQYVNIKSTSSLNKNLPKYTRPSTPIPTINPSPTRNSVSKSSILIAASTVKNYIDTNNKLPDSITINGFKYSMSEYSYLISKLIYNINSGKTSNIALVSVSNPDKPTGANIVGDITKTNYVDLAKRYSEYIEKNSKAPNYATATINSKSVNMQYQTVIYVLSIILDQTKTSGTLQSSLNINVLTSNPINQYISSYISPNSLNDNYNGESLAQYLIATKNCQVNNTAIKKLAESLTSGLKTDTEKATAIFNYVRDNIKYSFYYNTIYGATGTLSGKKGNCVDHAHLLIAMYRSVGLAARYVHGTCTFNTGPTYGHVWAQVLIGDQWVVADATSSSNTLGSINNWNTNKYTLKGKYSSLGF
ncbi:MAG: transglutaminase domain-containing protein [Methanobacteriaceae archaeon]